MGPILTSLSVCLFATWAVVVVRAGREWRDGEVLSRTSGALITIAWLLAAAVLATALAWRPLALDQTPAILALGLLLALAGAMLALPGYLPFGSVRQLYGMERGGLITDGVYRYSRNPQYTGIGLIFTAAAIIGASPVSLAVALAYWVGIAVWIRVEEGHLRSSFGSEYDAYRARAPRFLGRPRRAA